MRTFLSTFLAALTLVAVLGLPAAAQVPEFYGQPLPQEGVLPRQVPPAAVAQPRGRLARTGLDITVGALLAGGLVLAGGAVLVVSRRRPTDNS